MSEPIERAECDICGRERLRTDLRVLKVVTLGGDLKTAIRHCKDTADCKVKANALALQQLNSRRTNGA